MSKRSSNNLAKGNTDAATLQRLRSLAHVLDRAIAIPGTSYRIGLEPILGLLPIAGDYVGLAISAYIVLQAGLIGLPRETLVRMIVNILIDTLVGTIPVLGDFFDFTWKANSKNVELLEAHMAAPQSSKKADKWFIWLLLSGLLLVAIAITIISVSIISFVWRAITG